MLYRPKNVMPHLNDDEYEDYFNKEKAKRDAEEFDRLFAELELSCLDTNAIDSMVSSSNEKFFHDSNKEQSLRLHPKSIETPSSMRSNPLAMTLGHSPDATQAAPSNPANASVTAVPMSLSTGYKFPRRATLVTTSDHQGLVRALCDLASKITSLYEYFRYRHEWCALHLQINACALWAPGFRPWPTLPQKPRDMCADQDHAIQRDRLVIEAHWLYGQKEFVNLGPEREQWIPLFDHAMPFDFDVAERFTQQVWSNNYRTGEVLGLTPYQQCQMFSLRTDSTKKHMESFSKPTRGPNNRSIQSPQAVIRTALARWRERQPNLGNIDRLLARAQAKYYLGETASGAQVARLAGFISGTPPQDAKTVSQSLKGLESWLPTGGMAALGGSL